MLAMAAHYLLCFKTLDIPLNLEENSAIALCYLRVGNGHTMLSPVWWEDVLTILCTTYLLLGGAPLGTMY